MDWCVCSREAERDYTWDNTHASHPVAEYAREFLAPAFEGAWTASRFAALLRCPGSPGGVMLCVSVSTKRLDVVGRPIRTEVFLRAETNEEAELLAAFFAECLCKPDRETLYDAASPVARSVEGIYQTRKLAGFMGYCQSLPKVTGTRSLDGRWSESRGDTVKRREISESLSALVASDKPFLLTLTDCEPAAVLESLGSLFQHGTVRIFSKAIAVPMDLATSEGKMWPGEKWRNRELGGITALCIVAVGCLLAGGVGYKVMTCGRGGGSPGQITQSEAPAQGTNAATKVMEDLPGTPFPYAPFLAKLLDESGPLALFAGETDEDTAFNAAEREKDPETPLFRNSLFLRRRKDNGTDEWCLLLTTNGNWHVTDQEDKWSTDWGNELKTRFYIMKARFASDGRHLWLVCDPQTYTFFLVCSLDLRDLAFTLRVISDGDAIEESPDGLLRIKNRKTYLQDENGVPLGAAWYDEWRDFDGNVIRQSTPTQNLN